MMLTGFLKTSTVNHICIGCACHPLTHPRVPVPVCALQSAPRAASLTARPPAPSPWWVPSCPAPALPEHRITVSFRAVGEKRNYPSLHCVLRPAWKVSRDKEVKAAAFASAVMCWLTSGSQATSNCLMMAPRGGSEATWILLTLTLQAP